MKKLLYVFGAIALLLSCKNNSTTPANNAAQTSAVADVKTDAVAEDGLKSAIYESETTLPGGMGTSTAKITFDDYGKESKTQTVTSMSFGGKSINTTNNSLKKDEYIYSWVDGSKTGMKFKLDASKLDPNNTDFKNLSEEMKKKINYKDEGTETVDGRVCNVASYSSEKMAGKIWAWKGVPVKMELTMAGKTVTTHIKTLEENPSIPAGTFDVPSGIEFKEMSLPATAQK